MAIQIHSRVKQDEQTAKTGLLAGGDADVWRGAGPRVSSRFNNKTDVQIVLFQLQQIALWSL